MGLYGTFETDNFVLYNTKTEHIQLIDYSSQEDIKLE